MSTAQRTRAPSPAARRRRPGLLLSSVVIVAVVAAAVLTVLLWPRQGSVRRPTPAAVLASVPVGSVAPGVELAVAGASGAQLSLPVQGEVTLVSFLATQPDSANSPSRSQAVELVSLASQYTAQGLRVAIVDDSFTSAAVSALANTRYDWQLGSLPLLADPDHTTADRYGVASAPATLLIGRDGRVLDRWSGYVLTAVAAQAISAAFTQGPKA